MVVVDDFDEWLDFSSLSDLLGTVLLGDLQWVSFNTGNQSVTKWVRLGTFIMWFNDNNLLTGVTTTDNDSCVKKEGKEIVSKCEPFLKFGEFSNLFFNTRERKNIIGPRIFNRAWKELQ